MLLYLCVTYFTSPRTYGLWSHLCVKLPGGGCGGNSSTAGGFPATLCSASRWCDSGTFFKSGLSGQKTEIGRLWGIAHCHAPPVPLSDHNTVRPPRGAAPSFARTAQAPIPFGWQGLERELARGANWVRWAVGSYLGKLSPRTPTC